MCLAVLCEMTSAHLGLQMYYGSVDEMSSSDHKPVHAIFEAAVKTIIREKRAAVVADITRQLDAMENRSMPKVRLRFVVRRVSFNML
jgi:hypothetical protein